MDTRPTEDKRSHTEVTGPAAYEVPLLRLVGNLHDVVASTTQHLACDGGFPSGDGDTTMCG